MMGQPMRPILALQYMAAAAFLVVGLSHLMIWIRGREYGVRVLFALTVLCAAGAGAPSPRSQPADPVSGELLLRPGWM